MTLKDLFLLDNKKKKKKYEIKVFNEPTIIKYIYSGKYKFIKNR